MVETSVFVAYALTFITPLVFIGVGAMIQEFKATSMLAYLNLIALLSYFTYTGAIAMWVLIVVILVISLIFVKLYSSIIGGSG